ncbi:MAG: lipopolysaccharide biosynthesis protein [Acidimicrobiales bacterium]
MPSPLTDRLPVPDTSDELRRRVRGGLGWSLINSVAARALTLVVGLVMARLLTPEHFGVFAIGLVALNVLQSMNELGVSVAIVRWQGDPSRASHTAVTLSVVSSGLVFAGLFLAAPWVATSLQAPEAMTVLRILSMSVILDGISSIPNALLTRGFLQGRRAVADLTASAVSATLGIGLASAGYGALSLAWSGVAGNLCATVLILALAPRRPRPGWNRADARQLIRFGLPLAGASFLLLTVTNVDNLVVGRILGPTALGFYVLAYNLSSWPPNLLSMAIRRVAIPGFARLVDQPEELERAFARSLGMVVRLVLLGTVLLATLAEPVIGTLYGQRWLTAVGVVRWLAVIGTVRVAVGLCYDVLLALGRSRSLLWLQAAWLASLVPAVAIGAHLGGIRGAAMAQVAVALVIVAPAYVVVLDRAGISARATLGSLVRPLLAGCAAVVTALIGLSLLDSTIAQLTVGAGAVCVSFLAIAFPLRSTLGSATSWLAARRPRALQPVPERAG